GNVKAELPQQTHVRIAQFFPVLLAAGLPLSERKLGFGVWRLFRISPLGPRVRGGPQEDVGRLQIAVDDAVLVGEGLGRAGVSIRRAEASTGCGSPRSR